jgi:hypothetical protein
VKRLPEFKIVILIQNPVLTETPAEETSA